MNLETYRVFCLSEALSPVSHMMGTRGNEAVISREPVYSKNGAKLVPVLSGNAIRHKAIREPGSKYLVSLYDLAGKLTIDQLNFMFSGGSLTESSVTDNLKTIADLQRIFPLYRLLGGSLRNQIVSGSMHVGRGILLCEENRETINKSLPTEFEKIDFVLSGAEAFVGQYQYTRGDARKMKDVDFFAAVEELNNPPESNLMIYAGQTVMRSSVFLHEITLINVSYLELGAMVDAFERWQKDGGVIGGQSRIGHGKLKTSIHITPEISIDDAANEYRNHALSVRDEAIDWLNTAFAERKKKEKPEKTV